MPVCLLYIIILILYTYISCILTCSIQRKHPSHPSKPRAKSIQLGRWMLEKKLENWWDHPKWNHRIHRKTSYRNHLPEGFFQNQVTQKKLSLKNGDVSWRFPQSFLVSTLQNIVQNSRFSCQVAGKRPLTHTKSPFRKYCSSISTKSAADSASRSCSKVSVGWPSRTAWEAKVFSCPQKKWSEKDEHVINVLIN